MNSTEETSVHFLDYWRVIKVHRFFCLLVFLLVVTATTVWTLTASKQYDSMARIIVESDHPAVSIYSRESATLDMITFDNQFMIIQSKSVLYPVIEQLKLQQRWGQKGGMGDLPKEYAYGILKNSLHPTISHGTTIIEIRCRREDKYEAAEIANAVAHQYEKYRLDQKSNETTRGLDKIQDEYRAQSEEVQKAKDRVEELRKELNISDTGGLVQGVGREEQDQLRHKEQELLDAEISMKTQKLRLESLSKLSLPELKNAVNFLQPEGNIPVLINQLMDSERRLQELKTSALGPNHPDYKQAQTTYDTLHSQLDGQLNGVMQALKIAVDEQEQRVRILSEDLEKLRDQERLSHSSKYTPFIEAVRNVESQQAILDSIYARLKQERIEQGLPRSPVRVIEAAEPSNYPAAPNIPLNITLSVLVGGILGIAMAFLLEYLDTSIHKVDDIEKHLKIPVLAIVPRDVQPLTQMADASEFAEFYRVLRANIEFTRKNAGANSITFCSGGAGEGKSTTLVNTAFIYAQHGQRVLIVDSDIRRPSLHRILGLENTVGLTDVIVKGVPVEEAIRNTSVPNIDFISSGKMHTDALGILAMGRMRELISQLKESYDMVFFDSPPVLGISDATILAREVDLAVLVIQFRRFPRQVVLRAQAALEKAGVRLLGAVLNQVKPEDEDYYNYNYEYYKTERRKGGEASSESLLVAPEPTRDTAESF